MAESKQQRMVDVDRQLAQLRTADRGDARMVTLPRSESHKSSRRAGRKSAVDMDRFLSTFNDLFGDQEEDNQQTQNNSGDSTPKVRD